MQVKWDYPAKNETIVISIIAHTALQIFLLLGYIIFPSFFAIEAPAKVEAEESGRCLAQYRRHVQVTKEMVS